MISNFLPANAQHAIDTLSTQNTKAVDARLASINQQKTDIILSIGNKPTDATIHNENSKSLQQANQDAKDSPTLNEILPRIISPRTWAINVTSALEVTLPVAKTLTLKFEYLIGSAFTDLIISFAALLGGCFFIPLSHCIEKKENATIAIPEIIIINFRLSII